MMIFPAVDILDGRAVRLRQGRKDDYDVFADDPLAMALEWQRQGASWLHVVDLDGAFEGSPVNLPLVARMAETLHIPLQIGGGIRSLEAAEKYLDTGARRLIIGTMALEDKESFSEICRAFPGRIGVSLDAEKGRLKSRGWLKESDADLKSLLPWFKSLGVAFLVYTDIERDGMRAGVNIRALQDLLRNSPCPVIVAGGVASMEDVRRLKALDAANLEGFISGRALYEKTLDLSEALGYLEQEA